MLYKNNSNSKNINKWIHVIIQVIKYKEFDLIQGLFKPCSIFQPFDWYNGYSQQKDVK